MTAKVHSTQAHVADPCCIVIFGASGDLTHRLVVPALYNLAAARLLNRAFSVIGVARAPMTDEAFREDLKQGLKDFATQQLEDDKVDTLFSNAAFVCGSADDMETYSTIDAKVQDWSKRCGKPANCIFYLAVPPAQFGTIGENLGKTGLMREENGVWRRLIVEKPFGTDFATARALNAQLRAVMDETQIYRIDHYLGKETVQNILAMRFGNGLFEPLWNRNHIDHVQITVAESLTVGRRGRFYDATGAMRDMVPNHLFQLLSLITMEPPTRFESNAVRSEKAEALDGVQIFTPQQAIEHSVRAQYTSGIVGDEAEAGYRATADVAPNSAVETFVAMKLMVDNWRWAGVPFYLRTGKALRARCTEVAIHFKEPPVSMFRGTTVRNVGDNYLIIGIQPQECITLQFNAKIPGPTIALTNVGMNFSYNDYFDVPRSTGYETLLYDCMIGDQILFQREDGVMAGWRIVQPFLDAWAARGSDGLVEYAAGSQGPREANDLLAGEGRVWRPLIT